MTTDAIRGSWEFATAAQLEAMEQAALAILENVGLAVDNPWLTDRLNAVGFRRDAAGRHRIPGAETRRYLEDVRGRHGNAFTVRPMPAEAPPPGITLDPSWYALHFHDPETGRVQPFTVARHAEVLRLVEALRGQGVLGAWVAQASDVPGPLRPLMQYWVAGQCLSDPVMDSLLQSPVSLPFELAMAEALGRPIRQGIAFVFSPLRLSGESIDCVVQARDRFTAVCIGSMPTAGSTAPIRPGEALALAAAETIGAAMLLQAALDLPAHFGIGVFPANMRNLAISFGSPEIYLLQILSCQANAFFHGHGWRPGFGDLHIGACVPGVQATAEKAAVFSAGTLCGSRHFTGAGVLATDEIFSPEQLLYDMELRDHFQRAAAGWGAECDPARALDEVREAVALGSFAGLESTAALHRQSYWNPALFFRGSLGSWRAAGAPDLKTAARDRLRQLRAAPPYAPPAGRVRELDRILREAQLALGTAYTPPRLGLRD